MGMPELLSSSLVMAGPKPKDEELDLFGLTHPGKVRTENQDHFLLGTIHQQVAIQATSLSEPDKLPLRSERLASIFLVADGVGSGAGGEASSLAAQTVVHYVSDCMKCYHSRGRAAEQEFYEQLKLAALSAHETVKIEAASRAAADPRPMARGMATTMTLGLAVWPWLYVLQLGDSRCYYYWDGELTQVTRDQTLAQDLVDKGALPADRASGSPFSHVLASAIGGREASPAVSRVSVAKRGCVVLFCSDGLTKHVTNAEISEQIGKMESSEQLCRTLLDMALERGGSDNTTILAGRVKAQ
jgi:serine/threonine protein phosphatase PrpC